nr:integrase core domain-containing protein [Salinarimonas rosea]
MAIRHAVSSVGSTCTWWRRLEAAPAGACGTKIGVGRSPKLANEAAAADPRVAREKLEAWRRYYNEERPHGAIGYKCPVTLMKTDDRSGRPSV